MLATRQKFTYSEVLSEILKDSSKAKKLHPKAFFEKWIPLIYGVQPGEEGFRPCCIDLIVDRGIGGVRWEGTSASTAYNAWAWDDRDNFPKGLGAYLGVFDVVLRMLQVSGNVPNYPTANAQFTRKRK